MQTTTKALYTNLDKEMAHALSRSHCAWKFLTEVPCSVKTAETGENKESHSS